MAKTSESFRIDGSMTDSAIVQWMLLMNPTQKPAPVHLSEDGLEWRDALNLGTCGGSCANENPSDLVS